MADFGAFGLLPPLVAIGAAIATRRVFQSLLLGIFTAGIMVAGATYLGYDPGPGVDGMFDLGPDGPDQGPAWLLPFAAIAGGFVNLVSWIVYGIAGVGPDGTGFYSGHTAVVAFTVFLGALVALMQRSGGVLGFGQMFLRLGAGRRGGMLFASIGGIFLAIDDYFHVIAAGSVFRPVTDRLKISREKLSYLIDSTAAPAVILIPISTWAGYILGEISDARADIGIERGSFAIFLEGIPFNFYAILTLMFVVFVAATGTDWGPMARAERRAVREGKLSRDGAKPLLSSDLDTIEPSIRPRAGNLLFPVLFLVFSTVLLLAAIGFESYDEAAAQAAAAAGQVYDPADTFGEAIQNNPMPELTLAVSSFLTLLFAMVLYAFQGMKQDDYTDRALQGAKAMVPALAILALAWGIGNAVEAVGLGDWIASSVGDGLSPETVPLIAFVLAAIIAFATGTSFGTFAIMIPIALDVAFATGGTQWLGPAVAAVVGGAVFGDHCSPISDTTVMSSMAAQADHIDHVRTQLPYALAVALLAVGGYAMLAATGLVAVAWMTNLVLFAVLATGTAMLWRRAERAGRGEVQA